MNKKLSINNIQAFIFDFDGVLTNNLVYIDQNGKETVVCSRSDGLAFDALKKLNKPIYIFSTEKNEVVSSRCKKLKIIAIQGIKNKKQELLKLVSKKRYNIKKIFYIGNDVNDYNAMKLCGLSACPKDSHKKIKDIAKISLSSKGGEGVVRELTEKVLKINILKILYGNN